ncbi:hypothetical protein EDB89DRAFT_2241899 [Lactarius sanguifluus]|nr:hypothetical protein EDB89DRAFT_2241899 [Lactarius sanguifluus]
MLLATVGLPRFPASASAEPITRAQEYNEFYHGLDEVNLRSFLQIGAKIHKQDFALPASPPPAVDLCSTTPTPATRATPRKSSRRTPVDFPCFYLVGSPISEEDALLGVSRLLSARSYDVQSRSPSAVLKLSIYYTETTPGRGSNGRASVLGATISFTLELRAPPHPTAVTSSRLDRQRSAAGTLSPFPTITTPLILSSIPDYLRADFSHPTSSHLPLSPFVNMSAIFWSQRCSLFVDFAE